MPHCKYTVALFPHYNIPVTLKSTECFSLHRISLCVTHEIKDFHFNTPDMASKPSVTSDLSMIATLAFE